MESLTDNKSLRLYSMLDNLSAQNLEEDDGLLFDNFKPAKSKEEKEKDEKRKKALSLITEAKSKLIADLNIDVGGLAACSYNTKDAFFNIESILGETGDQAVESHTTSGG